MNREEIGSAYVGIEADTAALHAGLKRVKSDIDRTVEGVDGKRATVHVDVETAKFEKDMAEAKAELEAFDKRRTARAKLGLNTAELDKDIAKARGKLNSLRGRAEVRITGIDQDIANLHRKIKKLQAERVDLDIGSDGYEKTSEEIDDLYKEVTRLDGRRATIELDVRGADRVEKRLEQVDRKREQATKRSHAAEVTNLRETNKLQAKSLTMRYRHISELDAHRDRLARENGLVERLTSRYEYLGKQITEIAHERARGVRDQEHELELQRRHLNLSEQAGRVEFEIAQQRRLQAEDDKLVVQREKELETIPRLKREYIQLAQTLEKLHKARNKGSALDRLVTEEKANEARAKMAKVKAELERIGSPIELDIDINRSRDFGQRVKEELTLGEIDRGKFTAARRAGVLMGREMAHSTRDSFRRTFSREGAAAIFANAATKMAEWGNALGSASIRLGPFTTSVRGAIGAVSLLAPLLVDVVGAAGALVGSVGSATLGLGAMATGMVGGAIPALTGMGLVVYSVGKEFADVKTAIDAYDAALQKGNTKLAAKKLEELDAVMGGVSKSTREQIGSVRELARTWSNATQPGRQSVWTALGSSIKAASGLLPMFAKNTNEALSVAEEGITSWMERLNSARGRGVLNNLMDGFTQSLRPAMAALGNLTAYLGKLGVAARPHIMGMMRAFEGWTGRLNTGADATAALNAKVKGWVESLKSVGRFLQSTGRWMKSFFGGGVQAGNRFLDTMTKTLDRWTEFNNSVTGQKKLDTFFQEAVDGAKSLYNAIEPLLSTFGKWAVMLSPAVTAITDLTGGLTSLAQAISSTALLRGPLTALISTLGLLWGISRISKSVAAISGFVRGLFGISAAATPAVATSNALSGALTREAAAASKAAAANTSLAVARSASTRATAGAGAMSTMQTFGPMMYGGRAAGGAAKAAPKIGLLTKAANAGRVALAGLGNAVLGIANPLAGAALLAGVAGYAIYKHKTRTEQWTNTLATSKNALEGVNQALYESEPMYLRTDQAILSLERSELDAASAADRAADARKRVNTLLKEGKKGTDEYKDAVRDASYADNDAKSTQLALVAAKRAHQTVIDQESAAITASMGKAMHAYNTAQDAVREYGEEHSLLVGAYTRVQAEAKRTGTAFDTVARSMGYGNMLNDFRTYQGLLQNERSALQARNLMMNKASLDSANLARAQQGLTALSEKTAIHFGTIARRAGEAAPKIRDTIATRYREPEQAGRVAASAAESLRRGTSSKVVFDIVANSKNAEDAIRRLQKARLTTKRLEIITKGGDDALAQLKNIVGKDIAPKVMEIMASTDDAESKVAALEALGVDPIIAEILADPDPALAAASKLEGQSLNPILQKIDRELGKQPGDLFKIDAIGQKVNQSLGAQDSRLRSLPPLTQTVRQVKAKATGGVTAAATGATPGTASATDRAMERMYRGTLPTMGTASLQGGARIAGGPRVLVGEEPAHPEFVISTNPSYRSSNIEYLRQAAQMLGLATAAKGRTPLDHTVPRKLAQRKLGVNVKVGKKREVRNKQGKHGYTTAQDASPVLNAKLHKVETAEKHEANEETIATAAEDKANSLEPESLLKATYDPSTGLTALSVDQTAVNEWASHMQTVVDAYKKVIEKNNITLKVIEDAEDTARKVHSRAKANIVAIKNSLKAERKLRNSITDKKSPKRENAQKRIDQLDANMQMEVGNREAAEEASHDTLNDARYDANQRREGYVATQAMWGGSDTAGAAATRAGAQLTGGDSGGGMGGGGFAGGGMGGGGFAGGAGSLGMGSDGSFINPAEVALSQSMSNVNLLQAGAPGLANLPQTMSAAVDLALTSVQTRMDQFRARLALNPADAEAMSGLESLYGDQQSLMQMKFGSDPALAKRLSEATMRMSLTEAGLPGGFDSIEQGNAEMKKIYEDQIKEGQKMLADGWAGNDQEAYDMITGAAQSIKALQESIDGLKNSVGQEMMSYSNARSDLYRNYGSNFAILSTGSRAGEAVAPGGTFAPVSGVKASVSHPGDTNITVNNTYPTPPPDPHTYSKGLEFELQAFL